MGENCLIYSHRIEYFDLGTGHPFRGDRFREFMSLFRGTVLAEHPEIEVKDCAPASDEVLELVHLPAYLREVEEKERTGGYLSLDTPMVPGMSLSARYIVGAAVKGADLLMSGTGCRVAESLGGFHHAFPDHGEGFCVFNDVAIAARHLLKNHGLKRILILDTDAHQGNGTMNIFYDTDEVMFISLHQDPRTLYPGTGFVHQIGAGKGMGCTLNIPMPPYSGDRQYRRMLDDVVGPVVRQYEPELIIRNGGADPHFSDPLTNLGMTLKGLWYFGEFTRTLSLELNAPVLDLTVSGYSPVTPYGWLEIITGVMGIEAPDYGQVDEGVRPSWFPSEERLDSEVEALKKEIVSVFSEYFDFPD